MWLLTKCLKLKEFSLSDLETMLLHPRHSPRASEVFTKLLLWDGTTKSLLGLEQGEGYPFAWWDRHLRERLGEWYARAYRVEAPGPGPAVAGADAAARGSVTQEEDEEDAEEDEEEESDEVEQELDEDAVTLRGILTMLEASPPPPVTKGIDVGDRVEAKFDDGDEWCVLACAPCGTVETAA